MRAGTLGRTDSGLRCARVVGKASRKKADRRTRLDSPGVWHYHHGLTSKQHEKLRKFKERTRAIDAPPGESVVFAPVYTWREICKMRVSLMDELMERYGDSD